MIYYFVQYRMKRNADEPIYPPSAKPEDYQYNVGGDQQNYGKQSSGGYYGRKKKKH